MSLYQFQFSANRKPTLIEAAREVNLPVSELDQDYGVVLIDPANHYYVVRSAKATEGAFADVPIAPFGPVQ